MIADVRPAPATRSRPSRPPDRANCTRDFPQLRRLSLNVAVRPDNRSPSGISAPMIVTRQLRPLRGRRRECPWTGTATLRMKLARRLRLVLPLLGLRTQSRRKKKSFWAGARASVASNFHLDQALSGLALSSGPGPLVGG